MRRITEGSSNRNVTSSILRSSSMKELLTRDALGVRRVPRAFKIFFESFTLAVYTCVLAIEWFIQSGTLVPWQMIAPPNILRAARELIGIGQVEAAAAAGISRRSIQRLEKGDRAWVNGSVLLRTYYESRGIVFLRPTNGAGWGLIDNSVRGT
ncbi:helix-turn-helix transcriptional regulator [Agrobacterium vitis]|uniref:helix-turn-helix transcriptional regulator n=1 Tax=Allorhizobium ampelinum TaxID=3025782 RepID=UPI003AB96B1E|nr:helix-turn-helix transcriptional regulator [Allorhizobium ampelinum]